MDNAGKQGRKHERSEVVKKVREIMAGIVCLMLVLWAAGALAGQTKYAAGTTSAALTFGPATGPLTVLSVYATCDKENGAVAFYAKGGAGKKKVTTAPAATNVIAVSNTGLGLTTNDRVVYVHSDGTAEYRTVSTASTTSVTLSSAISQAGTASDYVYEVTLQGKIVVGYDGTAAGTNAGVVTSGSVFQTGGDSPLYCVLDGTSNAVLQVTADY